MIKNIPSTNGALRQYVLGTVLQSSKWRQSLCEDFDGWQKWDWQKVEKEMIPLWTDLSQT